MEFTLYNFDGSYKVISLDESLRVTNARHAAHCCFYSPHSFRLLDPSPIWKAYISMLLCDDGDLYLDFPGGYITSTDVNKIDFHDIVDGLTRDLVEEINLDEKYFLTEEDYCFTYQHKKNKECFHFFAKEVPEVDFLDFEGNSLPGNYKQREIPSTVNFRRQVTGLARVPLYANENEKKALPFFQINRFAGCTKHQLLHWIFDMKLASFDFLKECYLRSQI